jgi:sec-independent protein translocase protein TatB
MFDFAWSELAVIAVVALVVIGPKDLPRVLRTLGIWVNRARAVAREFQGSLDQMIREAELEDVRKQVEQATNINFQHEIEKTIDPGGEMQRSLAEPVLADTTAKPSEPAPAPAPSSEEQKAVTAPAVEPVAEPSPVKPGTDT